MIPEALEWYEIKCHVLGPMAKLQISHCVNLCNYHFVLNFFCRELTLFWSKLQRRINPSLDSFLERCRQFGIIARTLQHLFFLIRVIQSEVCVYLCCVVWRRRRILLKVLGWKMYPNYVLQNTIMCILAAFDCGYISLVVFRGLLDSSLCIHVSFPIPHCCSSD